MTEGRVLSGIEFARAGDDGSRPLLLDLYLPGAEGGAAPRPAVVHFHGGGWRTGERSSLGPVLDGFGISAFEMLTDAGFVVVSADYRLSQEAHFPAQLQDAKAAVRWLRNHAADYNVDPDRIYAWGDSAGGHLASLVGLTADADGVDADGAGPPRPLRQLRPGTRPRTWAGWPNRACPPPSPGPTIPDPARNCSSERCWPRTPARPLPPAP